MEDLSEHLPTTRQWMRSLPAFWLDLAKRGIALALAGLMLPLGTGIAFAQDAPPPPDQQMDQDDQGPPPQQWNEIAPDQLDQLVAPIALYPDSLVAQVLAAATYPSQVVDADRFVQGYRGMPPDQLAQMVNQQPWDPSVKALAAFPSVLSNMDRNLDWTTQLGNAYYNQPQDVMTAVQVDRQQAYQSGQLRSTPQLSVVYQPADIVIEPANPAVVYVPYYDPWRVWGWGHPYYRWYAPPPPPGFFMGVGVGFGFGVGVAVGVWRPWGWGYGHWGMGWGPHPYIVHEREMYVSRSVTVINHGYYGHFDGHFDRDRDAREWNRRQAAVAYRRGYDNGLHNGYDRGRDNRNFDRGQDNRNFDRGRDNRNFNRGQSDMRRAPDMNREQNYNRGQQNYNRPQSDMRRAPDMNREQNYNRGQQNNNRPQSDMRRAPDMNRGGQPNNNRPAPNFGPMPMNRGDQGRPQSDMRRAPDMNRGGQPSFNRPQPQPRGNGGDNRGGGGRQDNHGGGDKGGHPHR
ncbi:MAG TPA: DUF3300 domain-containing protein [Acidobacteriaceae bacterium]|nr:DUF3300 domain-containing protein [Acidobacteriaceae bacterium]